MPDVVIIGAGIAGLAHAWSAAERGMRTHVFETSPRASGATVRNFGMVWPIGQPHGRWRAVALESRARWSRIAQESGLWFNPCGSLHAAHREDEWAVLRQFAERAPSLGFRVELLDPAAALERSPALNPRGLLGALFSPDEACVDAPAVPAHLSRWLAERHDVKFEFGRRVAHAGKGGVTLDDGRRITAERIFICTGADASAFYPEVISTSGLRPCKLQMLRTTPQPGGFRIGTHLASGLTLRHYRNFEVCPGIASLRERIARETPELDQYGIHVMTSQNAAGEVVLGDSHEYGESIEPFDKERIDALILRELRKVFALPSWEVSHRWHGIYAKNPDAPVFEAEPEPGVHIFTGLGGSGMTMSFGLAEETWRRIIG